MELLGTSGIPLCHGGALMEPPAFHCPLRRIFTDVTGSGTVAYSSVDSAGNLYASWTADSAGGASGFVPEGGRVIGSAAPTGKYRTEWSAAGGSVSYGTATASFTSTAPTGRLSVDTMAVKSAILYGTFEGYGTAERVPLDGQYSYACIPKSATGWLPSSCWVKNTVGTGELYYIAGTGWKNVSLSALNIRASAGPVSPDYSGIHFTGSHHVEVTLGGYNVSYNSMNAGSQLNTSGERSVSGTMSGYPRFSAKPDSQLYYAGSYLKILNKPTYAFSGEYA